MDKVEIFKSERMIDLQNDINHWLGVNADKYTLRQISYATSWAHTGYTSHKMYSAMLWYTKKNLRG